MYTQTTGKNSPENDCTQTPAPLPLRLSTHVPFIKEKNAQNLKADKSMLDSVFCAKKGKNRKKLVRSKKMKINQPSIFSLSRSFGFRLNFHRGAGGGLILGLSVENIKCGGQSSPQGKSQSFFPTRYHRRKINVCSREEINGLDWREKRCFQIHWRIIIGRVMVRSSAEMQGRLNWMEGGENRWRCPRRSPFVPAVLQWADKSGPQESPAGWSHSLSSSADPSGEW